jgi:hypothetical protein
MKLAVKNVKIHDDISTDSMCFSASLYVDGKRVGTIRNDGRGGSNRYELARGEYERIAEFVATLPAKQDYVFRGVDGLEWLDRIDSVIEPLVIDFDERRRVARMTRKTTYFRVKGEKYPAREWQTMAGGDLLQRVKWIDDAHGNGNWIMLGVDTWDIKTGKVTPCI